MSDKIVTRVCKVCGIEKPIDEYYEVYGKGRWRLACKKCEIEKAKQRYIRRRDEILLRLHNKRLDPKYRAILKKRDRKRNKRVRTRNLEIYGTACSPEFTAKMRENQRQKRAENIEVFGYAYPADVREKRKLHYRELRTEALRCYGGKCECCGESRYEMLTFDHIQGNGHNTDKRGVKLVYDALKVYNEYGYPNSIYRLLCWNCNMSRGYYKYCPHKEQKVVVNTYKQRLKMEVINAYGGKCCLCGENHWEFLTIDHINGGGNKHRKQVGSGAVFYTLLKQLGWPKDEYRLLCANCNCSKKPNGWSQRGVKS